MNPRRPTSFLQLRDFIWTLIRTDFKSRYHGALSGFVWALLKPLAMFAVLYAVFSFLFPDRKYMYNLLLGLVLYNFFSEATSVGIEALLSKAYLVNRTNFPRWVIIVTSMTNAVITLVVSGIGVLIPMLWRPSHAPGLIAIALFFWYVVQLCLMVVGIALAASVLFVEYRDLNQVWDVVLRAGFFVAPVMYPIDVLPERFHFYLYLWPPTAVIQFSRQVLVGGPVPTLKAHFLLLAMTLSILFAGSQLFQRRMTRAMEKL